MAEQIHSVTPSFKRWALLAALWCSASLLLWNSHGRLPLAKPDAFLPPTSLTSLQQLVRLNRDFGFSHSILIGLEAPKQADVFSPDLVRLNQSLTQTLKQRPEIASVLSLASSLAINKKDGTLVVSRLFPEGRKPYSKAQESKLRKLVMTDPLLRGSLVSADAKATFIICQLKPTKAGQPPSLTPLQEIIQTAQRSHPKVRITLTGQPLVGPLLVPELQKDLRAFLPICGILFLLMLLWMVRTWTQRLTLLGLLFFGASFAVLEGIALERALSPSLALLPLLLWWLLAAWSFSPGEHVQSPLLPQGVILAGLCGLGLLASGHPMLTQLGLFAASTALLLALLIRWTQARPCQAWTHRAMLPTQRQFGVALLLFLGIGLAIPKLPIPNPLQAIYPNQSTLAAGEKLQRRHFGGAAPLLIRFEGDLQEPIILKSMERLGRRLEYLGLQAPQSIGALIRRLNQLLNQWPRIPDKKLQIKALWSFLEGQPALKSLVRKQGKDGIIQARVPLTNLWKQRTLLTQLQAAMTDLPLRYQPISLQQATPMQRAILLQTRINWIDEGIRLWLHRQTHLPLPPRLRAPIKATVRAFVEASLHPPKRIQLEGHRLQRRLWKAISDKDADLELTPPYQKRLLHALLELNRRGTLIDAQATRIAMMQALQGSPAAKDKTSIKYALRSIRDIVTKQQQTELMERFQHQLFAKLRTAPTWYGALTVALRKGPWRTPADRMATLRGELLELLNPTWILPGRGPQRLKVSHTGLHRVFIPWLTETIRGLFVGFIALVLLTWLLLSLQMTADIGLRLGLGSLVTTLLMLGLLSLFKLPLTPPIAFLLPLLGMLHIAIATPLQQHHHALFPMLKMCLWLTVPATPLLFAHIPLLQHVAVVLVIGPWLATFVAYWLLSPKR